MVHAVLGADGVRHADLLLRRVAAAPVATAIRRMSGQYSLLADAAVFTDCASGVRMAVAEEGDNPTLQRAYLASRPQPGASLLATVDGRVESRPPAEDGGAARPVLVVERYVAVLAGPCGTPHSTAELQETYWRLVELKGRAVVVADRRREPHVELHPDGRVTGSTGCNRLAGSYTSDAERISFGRTAGTMMACAAGADDERGFLDALGAAARWRIDGERLELLDAQGGSLARFESVYLR
jgi:heat shock protein HslJ